MCRAFEEQKELGIKEGMVLGIEKGIEQGRAEGLEQGAIEAKQEIVRNLHAKNFDIETIKDVTSLTEEEVKKIISC